MRQCPKCGSSYPDQIAFCPNDGSPTTAQLAADSLLGVVIDGRYRLEERIGEGGMGVVYRAAHVVLKRPFAIKIMRGEQAHDPEVVQRFVQEARAASAIGHPNIVNISDFGSTADGSVYLAMEFLRGQTLAEAMQKGPLAQERALGIFVQIAGALDAAHESGIIHRDLKPENIFLKRESEHPDFVKVLDFGIAKVKNAAAKITRTGMVFGTPHYMSPEQAAGQPVDHRSDIYSLGVIMYQVLAGQLPFDAASFMDLVTKHMYEPPVPLRQAGGDTSELPGALEAIVMRALQKKPEDRQPSMRVLQEELQRVQLRPGSDPAPRPASVPAAAREPSAGRLALESASSLESARADSQTSSTLEAAGWQDVMSAGDDDEPIAVPKQRRPVWVWLVGAGVVVAVAVLSLLSGPRPDTDADKPDAQPVAAGAPAASDPRAQTASEPPPAQDPLPSGLEAPVPEPPPAQKPAAAEQAQAPRPSKPRVERVVAPAQPKVAPVRPAQPPAQPPRRRPGAEDEPLDPWQ